MATSNKPSGSSQCLQNLTASAGYGFPLRSNIYIERCTVFACVSFWYHFHINTAKTNMNCQTDLQKNDWKISWLPSFWHHKIVSGWLCPLLLQRKNPCWFSLRAWLGALSWKDSFFSTYLGPNSTWTCRFPVTKLAWNKWMFVGGDKG